MTSGPRILVIGDIVTDVLAVHAGAISVGSDTPADIRLTGGGSAANTAAWLAWLGCAVRLVGVIGTDAAGEQRLAELTAAGVDCAMVRRSPDAPTGCVIVLANAAERSMLCDRGANLLLSPSDVDAALAGWTGHVHVSGYTMLAPASRPAGLHALSGARAAGLSTSVDAASAAPLRQVTGTAFLDWVRGTDVLLANLDEATVLGLPPIGHPEPDRGNDERDEDGPVGLARTLATSARHAVVKLGSEGAIWAGADGTTIRVPAAKATSVVDSTGAGDAFAAGLLAAWLAGADAAQALRAGARTGAHAVARYGGRPPRR